MTLREIYKLEKRIIISLISFSWRNTWKAQGFSEKLFKIYVKCAQFINNAAKNIKRKKEKKKKQTNQNNEIVSS